MSDFKKFTKLIIPYKRNAFFSVIFNAISTFFALFSFAMVIPFLRILFNPDKLITEPVEFSFSASALQHNLFYHLSNFILEYGKIQTLVIVSGIIVTAALFKNGFIYLHRYLLAPVMNGVARDYQRKIYSKLINLRLGFFSDERKGNLLSRMTSDVLEVRQSILHTITMLFTGPITVIIYMSFLFYSSYSIVNVVSPT